jgi:hypothetical protein
LKGKLEGEIRTLAGGASHFVPLSVQHRLTSPRRENLEQRKSLLRTVEAELDEAQEIASHPGTFASLSSHLHAFSRTHQISQMEVELHPMPASIRGPYAARVASDKSDLQKVKKTLVRTLSCSPFPL